MYSYVHSFLVIHVEDQASLTALGYTYKSHWKVL